MRSTNILVLLLLALFVTFSNCVNDSKGKNKNDFIKVHLILHSHTDAGWLKTFEEYYRSDVNTILTHTMNAVHKNKTRKFVWSDIGYLDRWWNTITDADKEKFKGLVKNEQIEFINGGWVMSDEACTTVDDVIRQLSEGHKFIKEKFGEEYLPTSGWQIDPFGHSMVTPYILSQMGYKHLILDRVHHKVKSSMRENKELQFLWRVGRNTGLQSTYDMFSHVLDDFYFSPPHLSFENENNLFFYTLDYNVRDITQYANERAKFYQSPHVLIPIGGDFHFKNAEQWMERFDQVEQAFADDYRAGKSNVIAVYSTLRQFFNETIQWHKENNAKVKLYDQDFFPYADDELNGYWTGYFTSRPLLKGLVRETSSLLRSAELFSAFQPNWDYKVNLNLSKASKELSILQHHDAITGTAREEVVRDYRERLKDANGRVIKVLEESVQSHLHGHLPSSPKIKYIDFEKVQNEYIKLGHREAVNMVLANSLGWEKNQVVTIKIDMEESLGRCPFFIELNGQNQAFDCSFRSELIIEANRENKTYYQLDFLVTVPPMGMVQCLLRRDDSVKNVRARWVRTGNKIPKDSNDRLSNKLMSVKLKQSNSLIESIWFHDRSIYGVDMVTLNQKMMYYRDRGGAYIFSIEELMKEPDRYNAQGLFWDGDLVKDLHIYYAEKSPYNQKYVVPTLVKIRIYNTSIWEIDKKIGFNYIMEPHKHSTHFVRFSTNIESNSIYSDNGLEMLKRPNAKDQSEAHKSHYPSISSVAVRDEKSDLAFICTNDRTKSVAGIKSGEFEFAIHRNLDIDDDKGLTIPNNDNSPVNVKSECYLDFFTQQMESGSIRSNSIQFDNPVRVFIEKSTNPSSTKNRKFSLVSRNLPSHIHILSLDSSFDKSRNEKIYFIRMMNILENGTLTSIDLEDHFELGEIDIIDELELSKEKRSDQFKSRLHYFSQIPYVNGTIAISKNQFTNHYYSPSQYEPITPSSSVITLLPLEIKCFSFKKRNSYF